MPFKEARELNDHWLPAWGEKAESSVHTVCIYAAKIFPLLSLYADFPFEKLGIDKSRGIISADLNYDDSNWLHRHIVFGRDILGRLIITLLLLSDEDAEHFPRLDWSYFKG